MFQSETPDNIMDLTERQIAALAEETPYENLPSALGRLNIIQVLYQALGLTLTNDLALVLASEPHALLSLATAGGGKTTSAQIKVICEKIYRKSKYNPEAPISGDKMLCLVYNRHNIEPMVTKHAAFVARLKQLGIKGLHIDDKINAATMHSFCDQLRKEFAQYSGLMGFKLIEDSEQDSLFELILGKVDPNRTADSSARARTYGPLLSSLYTFARESMLEAIDLENNDKFLDLGLSVETIDKIFTLYDKMKRTKRKYDFTDMLVSVNDMLETRPEVLERAQRYFEYIVADEIQDFTPIMMSILQKLVSDGTPLMCIGDDDQSIYGFRGADLYNTLDFKKKFDNSKVFLLSYNRRCPTEVMKLAKCTIMSNTKRYEKHLKHVKQGGIVESIPYNSLSSEHLHLLDRIQKLSVDERDDTVIAYREKISSLVLCEMLESSEIPFYVISGVGAFQHELYKHLFSILDMLESKINPRLLLNLYKVLPVKRQDIASVLKFDLKTQKFKEDIDKIPFTQLNYGALLNIRGFVETIERLAIISDKIATEPMSSYFDELWDIFQKYFWKMKRNMRTVPDFYDDYIEKKCRKLFSADKTYKEVFADLSLRQDICSRNQSMRYGIAVSTFHGLKGLEFSNVFCIDLDNEIFPNYSLIESKPYPDELKLALKEAETRLFYVAVTRSKENLFLYYKEDNPSRYVLPLLSPETAITSDSDVISDNIIENSKNSEQSADLEDIELFDPFASDLVEEDLLKSIKQEDENTDEETTDVEFKLEDLNIQIGLVQSSKTNNIITSLFGGA